MKNLKCISDHKDVSSYKEESDQRYLKDKESEHFGTSCASYHVDFENEGKGGNMQCKYLARVIQHISNLFNENLDARTDIVMLVI